jgi:acetylornithine deacetylase/succinyl-diaminopimelate desuccinylase-like protein
MQQSLTFAETQQDRFLGELREWIAIPSVSAVPEHKQDVRKAAEWLSAHLTAIGLEHVVIHDTKGHPIVTADHLHVPGAPTILVYGHYDVQPAEPLDLWHSPAFEMTERDGRLYGRGTADDKGQTFINLKAIESILRTEGKLPLNVKVIVEGEEEIGSDNLPEFLSAHTDLLKTDLVLISDTSMFSEDRPSICYGLRGLTYMQIDLTGPNRDLHSGSFGGSVHNPIQALSEIIAQLHDKNGKITIPGFYDKVRKLSARERAEYKKLPHKDRAYAKDLGVKELYGEKGFTTIERLWARPTLECNGIWGGFTGEGAKTVLPSKASAKISMRLVPDQSAPAIAKLFEKHITKIAPKTVSVKVTYLHGGDPAITPIDSPGVQTAVSALKKGFGKAPLFQREGGSIPIVVDFKKILKADTVLLGFGQPDENAHAPDEFLSLSHLWGGIRTAIHFFNELPARMK